MILMIAWAEAERKGGVSSLKPFLRDINSQGQGKPDLRKIYGVEKKGRRKRKPYGSRRRGIVAVRKGKWGVPSYSDKMLNGTSLPDRIPPYRI